MGYFLSISYNKDKNDKAVYHNIVMIKNYSLGSFWDLFGRLSLVVLALRAANRKVYFLHYDIYIKVLCTTLNLSLH